MLLYIKIDENVNIDGWEEFLIFEILIFLCVKF